MRFNTDVSNEPQVQAVLDIIQRRCRSNLLTVSEIRRQINEYETLLTQFNISASAWDGAELVITPQMPTYDGNKSQTAVYLIYDSEKYMWILKGGTRTNASDNISLPMKRLKLKELTPEQALKFYKPLVESRGITMDSEQRMAIC